MQYEKILFSLMIVALLTLSACVSPTSIDTTPPSSLDQVATIVAMTLQAVTPEAIETPIMTEELFPRSSYYLGRDNESVSQIYRMERDGKTKTQLTFEPEAMDGYDVSTADGSVAYIVNNKLVLISADSSNRRVLVDGGPRENNNYWVTNPVFSPDGSTIAYGDNKGLNLYDITTDVSRLVVENQYSTVLLPNGLPFPIEIYEPDQYSPDGTKLLVFLHKSSDHTTSGVTTLKRGQFAHC